MLRRLSIPLLLISICYVTKNAFAFQSSLSRQLFLKAEVYQNKGRYLEALSFYRDIMLNAGEKEMPASLYRNMGDVYYEFLESYDVALFFYRKQLDKFPHDSHVSEVKHQIARILHIKGERDQSLNQYQALLSSDPDYCKKYSIAEEIDRAKKEGESFVSPTLITGRAFPQQIRVLLSDDADMATVSAKDGLEFLTMAQSVFLKSSDGEVVTCRADHKGIFINNNGLVKEPICIRPKGKCCIEIDGKPYRGMLHVYLQDRKLMLVNVLPIEDYLHGVVSKEVPASWPAAVLEAQAIAARTYALYTMIKRRAEPYDLYSTVAAQVYKGKDSEQESSRAAVNSTQGLVISYNNRLAYTLYHSNSGGMTASAEEIWGWPAPYLTSKQDEFSIDMKGFQWTCSLAENDLQENFKQFGLAVPIPKIIVPLDRDTSGRISKLRMETPNQTFILSGNSFRLIAGPGKIKSSQFAVKQKDQTFYFEGRGFGHGAGMSQWGACQMARKGHNCEQILQFYYPGIKIVRVNYTIN